MSDKVNTTKQALISSGLKLFGEYGPQSTSTRMIAEHANVNLAAIKYHFGSKQGLYHAVIKHITSEMISGNKKVMSSIMAEINDPSLSKHRAKEIYKKLMLNIANTLIGNDKSKDWIKIIMREQANPTPAFEIIYDEHMKYILSITLKLSSIIYDCDINNKLIAIRQQIIIGQVLGFVVAQESFKRISGEKSTKKLKNEITQQISVCIDAIINTPL